MMIYKKSKYTYALVNLRPIVPGHVLVVPLRVVTRFKELTPEESIDYIETLQKVHKFIEYIYKADSLNIAIQDGPEAGQSIPHLHTHLIPRHKVNNIGDKIYGLLQDEKYDIDDSLKEFYARKLAYKENDFVVKPDESRFNRSQEDMEKETKWLTEELEKFYDEK
ncbi:hypothetical protein WICMUC_002481 [Wickerhamomyces mucosus]|uniref:Bis(5'-adenosyl)-triphosphatase n=1 Tax=Wickerhamomyces mucosus TaxID=1378264 RepID=A0A9P8PQH6_9ASCO|nr:hypothetical protein WICMUC_002481 [Wickerhamomyces mucosus]